jgi:hypothetical protein
VGKDTILEIYGFYNTLGFTKVKNVFSYSILFRHLLSDYLLKEGIRFCVMHHLCIIKLGPGGAGS